MAYTSPSVLSAGYVVGASDWNNYLTYNILYLLQRPYGYVLRQGVADYSLNTATTWLVVDATNLTMTFLTQSGRVRCEAIFAQNYVSSATYNYYDFYDTVSASRSTTNTNGVSSAEGQVTVHVVAIFTGLSTNVNHTFQLYYYAGSANQLIVKNNPMPILLFGQEF